MTPPSDWKLTRSFRAGLFSVVTITGLWAFAQLATLARQAAPQHVGAPVSSPPVRALSPYVEAHSHFDERDPERAVAAALEAVDRQNAARVLFLTMPETFDSASRVDAEAILPAARKHADRVSVLGGGATLNAMIQRSVTSGDAGPDIQKKFKDRAEELLREGAVGFGEMAAEHFAGATPYQYAPADHPFFLLLADIAARHGVTIDIHMEAVPQAMPLPADLKSPPNPPQLHENIAAFERLLAHNSRAKIIWAHGGSDATGYRTPDLTRRLLRAHPNLYQELKADPRSPGKNYPLADDGKIKPEWLKLFEDFPDRFLVGTDQHYPEGEGPQRWQAAVLLLNQLPEKLRRKIGMENALRLYPVKRTGTAMSDPGETGGGHVH